MSIKYYGASFEKPLCVELQEMIGSPENCKNSEGARPLSNGANLFEQTSVTLRGHNP